jgi:uncharacterized Tic20 family protein
MESVPPSQDGTSPQGGQADPSKDERTMALICHLLPFAGFLLPHAPVFNIVAPLLMWLIKKDEMPFLKDQGREVVNFQITLSIVIFICTLTFWLILPILVALGVAIAAIVLMILGAIKASDGVAYRYPFSLRLIK